MPSESKSIVLCKDKLDFYIGNDDLISVAASLGCKGVISVMANILPSYTHNMVTAGISGNCVKCSEMQKDVMDFIECLFMQVNPIVVKELMNRCGFDVGECRLPLTNADYIYNDIIETVIKQYSELILAENK